MKTLQFLILTLLMLSFPATAKTLYVDIATGDDGTNYSENSESRPWATLGRAVWGNSNRSSSNSSEAAQAGDTVIVRAGTYSTTQGTGERYDPIYNPVNNGTPGNEIIIRADGLVTLQSNTATRGEPIIGTLAREYIVWDGFFIDETNVNTKRDTGPVVVWGSDNVIIQNLVVRGKSPNWGDNHNSIRLENSRNSLIRNNELYENRGASNQYNGSTIMMYDCNNIVIEHNEIHDSQGGVFVKGQHGPTANHNITVRYNLLYNLDVGITHGITRAEGQGWGTRAYQNIIRDTNNAIIFIGYNDYSPANVHVVNNIIHNTGNGIFLKPGSGWSDIIFRNNIIFESGMAIQGEDRSDVNGTDFSHNVYASNSTLARIAYTNLSFSGWQSAYGRDSVGSSTSDPSFLDARNRDYHLSPNSLLRGAGVDTLNLQGGGTSSSINIGAYVTGTETIGLTSALVDPPSRTEPPTLQ